MTDQCNIIIIELMDELPDTPEGEARATSIFTQLQLDSTRRLSMLFENGLRRHFAVFKAPTPQVSDCRVVVMHEGAPLIMVHGTDCTMVRHIEKDIRTGLQSDFVYCDRRIAGGAFELIEGS